MPSHIVVPEEGIAPGLENAAGDALQLPMLLLAQPLTPEVMEGKMRAGDMFMSNDREESCLDLGQSFPFIPVFHFREFIEWGDREKGEGMLSRSKDPKGDLARRCMQQWQNRSRDTSGMPNVVEYHVFFVLFQGMKEPVMLPLSKTKFKKGKLLLSLAMRRGSRVPLYGGKYSISAFLDQSRKGDKFYNFEFASAGWATKDEYELCEKMYNLIREQYQSLMVSYGDEREVVASPDGPSEY